MIQEIILPFLKELVENNNREWFHANKAKYTTAKEAFEQFNELLIAQIAEFDPMIKGMEPKDCIFRIFRDVRFSNDKRPYKTNFGTYIAQGGRKSMNPGYYLHIEPNASFLGGGMYMPAPDKLKAIRTRIFEDAEELKEIINDPEFAEHYKLYDGDKLKTAPKGFPKDFENIDLLRYKHYAPTGMLSNKELTDNNFFDMLLDRFEILKPFNDYLRDSIE